ncbi:TetR/AcrR family transcriptional regulator [Streptococcus macacae]|uniref:Transcriptional regulator, TetR family n=1 Tax=Streptococcus macacae NCTC 11558 TaxID=764298 RepID=G5JXB6_9STRE|nr:TetR/AcrR family transcriptional regulator [Streptococcus macacae]EHJ52540.1 transcriptional regulator, TetR family [Streptococcus macacae NCTC 11558]SUN79154.1 TetR family transcriptional regulator [Streptococcus macacae NCTC 11558]
MKQSEKSIQTQIKIKEAALALFSKKGYQDTTMSDIVQLTALSKGAVYHHFQSKEEILQQLMEEEMRKVTDAMKALAAAEHLPAKLRLLDLLDFLIGDEGLNQLSQINWSEKVPFGLLFTLRNTVNVLSRYVSEIIEQGNQNGEFSCPYPFELASSFVILLDVWLDPTIADSSHLALSQKIDYLAYFLNSQQLPLLSDEKCQELKKRVSINQQ